ncbi:MAG: substrate-binding domain-containing protein [Roseburia sp.]|nr:substrate-binding domain-containing protein [Roseburia sp.]MCM1098191.1 substrate-binding domain-containing protein [Ruminococcus flavefaciens]
MKKGFKKLLCFALTGILAVGMLAGCGSDDGGSSSAPSSDNSSVSSPSEAGGSSAAGTEEPAGSGFSTEGVKIGVLVADVSGEEAQGFRSYYENYLAEQYGVTFTYTDALASAEDEKTAIEKFVSQGYQAIISLSSSDRAMQIETCEEYGVYYAIASGVLDSEQYETYKGYEYFAGQIGPSNETEFEAGKAMGEYYKGQGVSAVAIYGAFIPNPMHVYRAAGVLAGLGDSYGGTTEMDAIAGQIFQDQGVKLDKVSGDVEVAAYLQGYGDTTTDELNAAIQKSPDAFLSVGMATTFFTQSLNEAGISFADIDSFTQANGIAIKDGKLTYLAGKYSSSIGPVFALIINAVNGNVIRDNGNAVSISQGYLVATDGASFDEYYVSDNGDAPIYDKAALDSIIGANVTFEDVKKLVESK